jgi:O-antigen ligase
MVFTQRNDHRAEPERSRLRHILIATPVMLAPILSIVSAKLALASLVLTTISVAVFASMRCEIKSPRFEWNGVTVSILAFAAYSALSALWSPVPATTLLSVLGLIVSFAMAYVCIVLSVGEHQQPAAHMAEGLWIGLFIASLYYVIDVATGQSIKMFVYNSLGLTPGNWLPKWAVWKDGKVVTIPPSDATRNAFALPLLLWAGLMAVEGVSNASLKLAVKLTLFVVVVVGVFLSPNDTAKLALIVGAAVFTIARISRRWSLPLIASACIAGTMLAVPIALSPAGSALERAAWLPANGSGRLAIWRFTAAETLKSPWIGVGANANSEMLKRIAGQKKDPANVSAANVRNLPRVPHPHNIYLQTWFELGFVGAALLTLFGCAILQRIGQLSDRVYPYGLATFSTAVMLAASSYGLWQFWFLAMFAWTACVFQIGRLVMVEENDPLFAL